MRQILRSVDKAPTMWRRYADDVFAIWPHSKEHLPSIEFIAQWAPTSVTFLNTKVTIDEEGRLVTDLHVKPTDTHC